MAQSSLRLRGLRFALFGFALAALSGCGSPSAPSATEGSGGVTGMGTGGTTQNPEGGGTADRGGGSGVTGGASNAGAPASGGNSNAGAPAAGGNASGADFPIPYRGQVMSAQALAQQLAGYDPGSLLRCDVASDASYQAAIDALGGVSWGYGVSIIEDQSKPRYQAGVQKPIPAVPGIDSASAGASNPVEIVKADIVAVTDAAALFYSTTHGLMLVGIEQGKPEFHCALQLPGRVNQFYFHEGQLVVMTKSQDSRSSQLLHFNVQGTELGFVEAVDLGHVDVLDSRRFNRRLVFYTTFSPEPLPLTNPGTSTGGPAGGAVPPGVRQPSSVHRALRVFELGATLKEELYDTLIDTTVSEAQLVHEQVTQATPLGSQVSEARSFGRSMWASDHYFVVTEQIDKTFLSSWASNTYSVCTASHTTETPFEYCWTEYETRPNPDYVEPDNSGGDRACKGTTLSDCLMQVARVSNKTIQVPVARKCEQHKRINWFCDASEQRTSTYPLFRHQVATQLYIYEYTDAGFVRVDSTVHEVTSPGLHALGADAKVDAITTSAATFDLAVPGAVQTLYFQNGYLYVISQGVLQVYAMGGGSMVRTATLPVVNESLQASLFSSTRLFLSDFGWAGGDHSTLRVVNLENPAFPRQDGATHQLPGGHRSILAAEAGIFTIGSVNTFMGQTINAIKLGLFSDPFAGETAYSILGTDLKNTRLGEEASQFWNGASQRLVLPYQGNDERGLVRQRVGLSRVEPGSIVSEGAVALPEFAQRVRPLPFAEESYLTFATNSIEWLRPEQKEWKSEPVLEYFEPYALYRRTPGGEYAELQHLGARCRLYFAHAGDINQRENGAYSEEFECLGYPQAYDRQLIFSATNGLEFADDHSIRKLSADEIATTQAAIVARQYCLLELAFVPDVRLDPDQLPPLDQFTCMSPTEYNALINRLLTMP